MSDSTKDSLLKTMVYTEGLPVDSAPSLPSSAMTQQEIEFQRTKTSVHREILNAMNLDRLAGMTEEQIMFHIQRVAQRVLAAKKDEYKDIDQDRLLHELMAESFGLGPIECYMSDPEITDILVNGPDEVYIEKQGVLYLTPSKFADENHLMQIIQRVVSKVGRRVDEQTPLVDARLADGSRINAIIKPLAIRGPILSIRRFGNTPLSIEDLIRYGSIPPEAVAIIEAAVRGKINVMISGGTGSGKTTMLNCVSKFIPDGERLVTIEDSVELKLQRSHVVSLEARLANNEGVGAVTARDLVRNSLRMRPDRIILGEVRGVEALDMLQAMNTGHEGSLTTIHANGIRDSLSRLEVMVSMTGLEIPTNVVRRYISAAITLVIQLSRLRGGVRRLMGISEITGFENDNYAVNDLLTFQQQGADSAGKAVGRFAMTGNRPQFLARLEAQGITLPASLFEKRFL